MHVRFQDPELPSLAEIEKYWSRSQEARWFSNGGPCLNELTHRLERYSGEGLHAVPVSSATVGLLIALRAMTTPENGRYVVVPSYTFAATAAIIDWMGFEPYYIDIDAAHWHASPDRFAQALDLLGDEVAGAVLCSTYGSPPPRSVTVAWEEAARSHAVPLLVDSAAGFGSVDSSGAPLGSQGDAEVFSFHATKPFAIGEGGVVVTSSARIAEDVRRLINFGFDANRVVSDVIGLNGKMDELHAATALCVLDRFPEILAARQQFARVLREAIEPLGHAFQAGSESSSHQFLPMLCSSRDARDDLIAQAAARDIELRAYFADPLHTMPAFAKPHPRAANLDVTNLVADRVVCLPIYNRMSDEVLGRLIELCTEARR